MRTIETTITINAPAAKVWQVLMDFEKYPQWNPFIKSIKGNTAVGSGIEIVIQPEGQKPMPIKPVVVTFEPEREFAWLGKMGVSGIFDGEHHFRLEPQADGQTVLVHYENFKGILVGPVLGWIGKSVEKGFNAMNEGLKRQAEMR